MHFPPRPDRHLAGHDNSFVSAQSPGNDDVISLALAQCDHSKLSGIVRLDHIDERSFLTDLSGLVRYQHRRSLCVEYELYVHKLTGPEMSIRVRNGCTQVDRSGAVLDSVIQELNSPGPRAIYRVGRQTDHRFEVSLRHLFLNFRQITLGNGEVCVDRIEPLDRQEGSRIRLHNVAYIDQTGTRTSVDRRMDIAVFEI